MGTAVLDTDELPTVVVGEMVLWSPDHGAAPCPAVVVEVGSLNNRSRIAVQLIQRETMTLADRSGVPHRDDPSNSIIPDEDVGVWRLGHQSLEIQRLEEEIEEIKLLLAGAPAGVTTVK